MAKYIQTATSAQSHVDYLYNLTNGLNDDVRNEALFHLACIMNLGFRCNPRPAQGVIRKNALEIAFRKYPQVKFNFTEVKGYTGKMFKALNIQVEQHVSSESESSDE